MTLNEKKKAMAQAEANLASAFALPRTNEVEDGHRKLTIVIMRRRAAAAIAVAHNCDVAASIATIPESRPW